MTRETEERAPLHRRYDAVEFQAAVKRRYKYLQEYIHKQVSELQRSPEFRSLCQAQYRRGIKDWVILSVVNNTLLNYVGNEKFGRDPEKWPRMNNQQLGELLKDRNLPPSLFIGESFEHGLGLYCATALSLLGFEIRTGFKGKSGEEFLRDRLNFFEFDLPHRNLFEEEGGEWPKECGGNERKLDALQSTEEE